MTRHATRARPAVRSVVPAPAATAFVSVPPAVARTQRTPGRPLEPRVRREMQGRVGFDLSGVRIHAGPDAAAAAAAVDARAYTLGRHVVFGRGRYAPGTAAGRALLAHELIHTRQQRGGNEPRQPLAPLARTPDPADAAEREARAVATGSRIGATRRAAPGRLQRTSIWEDIARLFGFGTFPDDELQAYLTRLDREGAIEGGLFSDDRARAVVRRWVSGETNYALTPKLMSLLVQEMLDGVTLEGDEKAILALLRGADDDGFARIVREAGEATLRDKIDEQGRREELDGLIEAHRTRLATGNAQRGDGAASERPPSDRLLAYLRDLDRRDAPLGRSDSHRLAREVVARWRGGDGRFFLPPRRKVLLLLELIRRTTTVADEAAMLEVIEGAGDAELREIFVDVPEPRLRAELSGVRREAFGTHVEAWRQRTTSPEPDEAGLIERIVVDQEIPQSVTVHYQGGATFTDIASTGKGHCAVSEHATRGAASSEAGSRVGGSNLTPVGTHDVQRKLPKTASGVELWTEIHIGRSVALHEYEPRIDGTPLSHGCVRLRRPTAQRIYDGSRSRVDVARKRAKKATEVEVRGLARPRVTWPALQAEWANDFRRAGSGVPDGEPPAVAARIARSIARQRATLQEIYAIDEKELQRRIDELRADLGGDIPSAGRIWYGAERRRETLPKLDEVRDLIPLCSDLETVEERRLGDADLTAMDIPEPLRQLGDGFVAKLAATRTPAKAEALVRDAGTQLWQRAANAAQFEDSSADDRPLYWTRLRMMVALRTWTPHWTGRRLRGERMSPDDIRRQRGELLRHFERASRGLDSATFEGVEEGVMRILVSGFDPFQLEHGLGRSNPSGAAALALDGQEVGEGDLRARIEAVVFPVRFPDFDAGVIERFFGPYLRAERPPDMILTLSMGVGQDFEVERFAGRRRSASATGNLDRLGGGSRNAPAETPGLAAGREFLRTALPERAIRRTLGRDRPLSAETEITEIRAGESRPVRTTEGPAPGSRAVRGSGGGYLSNEIAYRTLLLRRSSGATIPVGHVHTPYLGADADDAARRVIVTRVRQILEASVPEL